ncbi:DUF2336 domain-containing protein [Rhodoplanes sp. Z2-YC6860]|uniref:DUF2336 domain-containing protein n=1 Tax=Rhodoplanes sp. Z2-YC6860 TaxID=674703 RepID=UPI0018DB664C|nr:DUF2336 domain-containing protein [Rhodoplanes sp. Z2-YC6860]
MNTLVAELDSVIAHGSPDRRRKALDHLTTMFLAVSEHFAADQLAVVDDVFVRLSADIETATRRILAIKLADNPRSPPRIIEMLACDDAIEVAEPVLTRSPRLDDRTLIRIISQKSQEYLLAVSKRSTISASVTDALINRGDHAVLCSVAGNDGATFSDQGYRALTERAYGDDELSTCVGLRRDVPAYLFAEIVRRASEEVRLKLEASEPHRAQEIRQTVAEVSGMIRARAARDDDAAKAEIDKLHQARLLSAAEVERYAQGGRTAETIFAIAALGDVPVEVVERAMAQKQPELLVLIARAVGLPWPATKAVLVLARGANLPSLTAEQALRNFERMKPSTAQVALRYYTLQLRKGEPQAPRR